jgi:putative transposase
MERKLVFAEKEFYHLYNRGVEKRKLFLDANDYARFVKALYIYNGTQPIVFRDVDHKYFSDITRGDPIVAIGAYVLMPNHFHILVREIVQGGISKFMGKLQTSYAMYFNIRNKRNGALFQGPFRARHLDDDRYLKYVISYIHLNPVKLLESKWKEEGIKNKKKARSFLAQYQYSSYQDYLGIDRKERIILNEEHFPGYFKELGSFDDEIEEWLSYKG